MAKLRTALHRVKRIPTLLVWGDRDCTVSLNSAIKLKRKLRASELIVLPGGGHSVFEETPEESNRIMLEWLGRHSLSTPRLGNLPRAAYVARRTRGTAAMRRFSPGN
jgi:alpha-beta hydrolase superfamily lysophospholipase